MALLDLYFAHGLVEGLELALQHPRDALADLADFGLEHRSHALLQVCPCLPQCLLLVLCGALFFPLLQSTLDNVVAELLNILCVPGYLGADNVFLML